MQIRDESGQPSGKREEILVPVLFVECFHNLIQRLLDRSMISITIELEEVLMGRFCRHLVRTAGE